MGTSTTQPAAPAMAEPGKEHQWLQKLVGEWTADCEMPTEPGQPPARVTWTETVRSLGGVWFVAEGHGEMPGGGATTTLMTLGYDPRQERYVGSWVGSMMAHLWVYEGVLDEDAGVLTLDTEGPSMTAEGELAGYRDVLEFKGEDHRVMTSHSLTDEGTWQQFMAVHYQRTR